MPPEVGAYLRGVADRLAAILGPRLVGVYVGGSLALGGYEHGRSDVDVAAVAADLVPEDHKVALVAALRHESYPCPARGLELVLYRLEVVRSGTTAPGFELNLDTGEHMALRVDTEPDPAEAHWFAIDRSILHDHGVAIVGPPAQTVFAPIPRAELLPVLVRSLDWHAGRMARGDDAVLNAARALRWALEGIWSSKPAAGRWALSHVTAPDLVRRALTAREGGRDVPRDEAAAFLANARQRMLA